MEWYSILLLIYILWLLLRLYIGHFGSFELPMIYFAHFYFGLCFLYWLIVIDIVEILQVGILKKYPTLLFVFGFAESSLLRSLFFSCCEWELLSGCGVQACPSRGFSCSGAWALGIGAQWLWYMGLVALQHVGWSSQTRDQTFVPCTGRQILNHWATKEVQGWHF